jgi:8-oxo-dGTP pyrophosphatase MutT (NUDIX family)
LHRRPVLELLDRYGALHPGEQACVARVRELVEDHADCFERTCLPGHLTASAWIVSSDRRHFLLGHHRKLDRWLQLGGHADGDCDLARVALREAREESGMRAFAFVGPESELVPIDLDVHRIPARDAEPPHEHHDVRFLLVAAPGQRLRVSPESRELRWFAMEELEQVADEESLLRLGRKARARLAEAP